MGRRRGDGRRRVLNRNRDQIGTSADGGYVSGAGTALRHGLRQVRQRHVGADLLRLFVQRRGCQTQVAAVDVRLQVALGQVGPPAAVVAVPRSAVRAHEHVAQARLLHSDHLLLAPGARQVFLLAAAQAEDVLAGNLLELTKNPTVVCRQQCCPKEIQTLKIERAKLPLVRRSESA